SALELWALLLESCAVLGNPEGALVVARAARYDRVVGPAVDLSFPTSAAPAVAPLLMACCSELGRGGGANVEEEEDEEAAKSVIMLEHLQNEGFLFRHPWLASILEEATHSLEPPTLE
ncbi:unnamed protein product, partial [Discosporangium mesarthrocarpum]